MIFLLAFLVSGLFAGLTLSPGLLLLLFGLGLLVFAIKVVLVAFLFFVGLAKLLAGFPRLVPFFPLSFVLVAGKVIGLSSEIFLLSQSVLFSLELSTPFVVELFLLALLGRESSQLLFTLFTLFLGLVELIFLALGLHEVILSPLRLTHDLVADRLFRGVRRRWDIFHCVMVFVVPGWGMLFTILWEEVRADVVQIIHLFALVVLEKAFVGAEMLLFFGVEAVGNPVEHLWGNLVKDVLTVSLAKIVHVVAATLSQSQESH